MRKATLYLLSILATTLVGCEDSRPPANSGPSSELTHEETAGLAILTRYAMHLMGQEDFPELDPFEPSPEGAIFREILKDVCPNAMDAEVDFGRHAYCIGPQPMALIAGDRTNHVNPRVIRNLDTSDVVRHSEIEFDYTTLDGESGSIPATYLMVERLIEGRVVNLIFSTKRTQQAGSSNGG